MNDSNVTTIRRPGDDAPEDRRAVRQSVAAKSDLVAYWNTARRYKWSILGVALLGALIGFLKASSEIPIYSAQLTLLIEPKRPRSGSVEEIMSAYTNPYRFYQTQSEIIKSRAIAERIADKLNPDHYLWLNNQTTPSLAAQYIAEFRKLIGQAAVKTDEQPRTTSEPADKRAILANLIKGRIQVQGGDRSQVVKLGYESRDPEFAAAVVNNAASAYIELSLDTRLNQVKVASGWLNTQVEELRQKVAESEARLQSYQTQESLVDTEKLTELTSGRLSALSKEVTAAQVKVSSLEKRYGNKHPAMIAARAELTEVLKRLQNEKGNAVKTQTKGFQLAKLERDVATYRQLYDQFLTRFKETDLAMRYDVNDVRVIDRADPPATPVRPNKRSIITTWVLLGLAAGTLLAWLRDFMDNTFKSPHDVEQEIALPVLGIVPFLDKGTRKRSTRGALAQPERFYIHNPNSGFSESINHIRTSVLYTDVDDPPKTIMITSAVQSEGKTTLCTNLALSFGQLGRTLILDADLRKPRVAAISGLEPQGGLADVVAGHASVTDVITQDEYARDLYIIKSGVHPPNPLELILSDKFAKLLSELRTRFNYIIIDSPPVLPVSDAIVLGSLADATILVIQAEQTHRSASINALNSLHSADVNVIGIALTQMARKKTSYYSDGYYYGHYGKYYGSRNTYPA